MDLDFEVDTPWVELAAGKRWPSKDDAAPPLTSAVDARFEDGMREEGSIVEPETSSMNDAVRAYEPRAQSYISSTHYAERVSERFVYWPADLPAVKFCASCETCSEPLLGCWWVSDLTLNDLTLHDDVLEWRHRDGKLVLRIVRRTTYPDTLKEYEILCASCEASLEIRRRLMGAGRVSDLTFDDGVLKRRDQDGRPWAEPPLFDYGRFNKDFVPSDKMILEMFPTDPVARTTYRDTQTEYELFNMFSDWSCKRVDTNMLRCGSVDFHNTLIDELIIDQKVVGEELDVVSDP